MPELPEVETILRGLIPQLKNAEIVDVIIRTSQLRWPIPSALKTLQGQKILHLSRRGKYLLLRLETGTLIIHLGMSGSLRILTSASSPTRHDHVDILLENHLLLRYNDPRRFGSMLWTTADPRQHPLLKDLGLEPLEAPFTADYLIEKSRKRRVAIKPFIMNHQIVTGVGNIYATEALFLAGIHPSLPAGFMTIAESTRLVSAIKQILKLAIAQGGTTLKDFVNSEGKPGYFSQKLHVYGREGLACVKCGTILESMMIGQRRSVYCKSCQPLRS